MKAALGLRLAASLDAGFFAAVAFDALAFGAAGFAADDFTAGLLAAALAAGFLAAGFFAAGCFAVAIRVTSSVVNSGRVVLVRCAAESMIACPRKRKGSGDKMPFYRGSRCCITAFWFVIKT